MLRRIPARPEQTQSHSVIREALRAAALAPSDRDAIDVLGAALHRLAQLACEESACPRSMAAIRAQFQKRIADATDRAEVRRG